MATKKRRKKRKQKKQMSKPLQILLGVFIAICLLGIFLPKSDSVKEETKVESQKDLRKDFEKKYDNVFYGEARNDVTGKWRVGVYATNDLQEDMAAEYYKAYFESDDEIHALVNFNYNTTAKITKNSDNSLSVTYYDYLKGEEHDAKLLFGGTYIKTVDVTID